MPIHNTIAGGNHCPRADGKFPREFSSDYIGLSTPIRHDGLVIFD
jgi:hypothetical protein